MVPAELGGLELEPVLDMLSRWVRCERSTPFSGVELLTTVDIIEDGAVTSRPNDELFDSRRSRLRCFLCFRSSSFFAEPGW